MKPIDKKHTGEFKEQLGLDPTLQIPITFTMRPNHILAHDQRFGVWNQ